MAKRKRFLERVEPAAGDACRVLDFAGLRSYQDAELIAGRIEAPGEPGRALVSFNGREAELAIEPDWQALWQAGQVEYREVCPVPEYGQRCAPCPKDNGQSWLIELPLFGLHEAAQHFGAQTFDKHWYVCLRAGYLTRDTSREAWIPAWRVEQTAPRGLFGELEPGPERKRAWVRWDVGCRQWVQVGHPEIVAMLEQHRPR